MANPLKLALVEVTMQRDDNPRYKVLLNKLRERFYELELSDWKIERFSAEELGPEGLITATSDYDAIVILGGEDVHPSFAKQPLDYHGSGNHRPLADEAQIALVLSAYESETPLLGICRGGQLINVALGGKLIQHIESDAHRSKTILDDLKLVQHPVSFINSTKLAQSLINNGIETELTISSAHHQAVDSLADGLVVAAKAPDGIIEAFEHTTKPIFGVQFHPEDYDADPRVLLALLDRLRVEALAKVNS